MSTFHCSFCSADMQSDTSSFSVLPAITCNSILYWEVEEGNFDGPKFTSYIECLLEFMNPWPGPRSVLLLDNCSIHKVETVRALCDARYVS